MNKILLFWTILISESTLIFAYSSGAPKSPYVCDRRQPHHGVRPQEGESPYVITVNNSKPGYNDFIEVSLRTKNPQESFKGYLLQATPTFNGTNVGQIGWFSKAEKTFTCSHSNDTATHSDNRKKQEVSFTFKVAGGPFYSRFQLRATVVSSFTKFWTDVVSEPISLPDVGNSPGKMWTKTTTEAADSLSRGKQSWENNIKLRLNGGFKGMINTNGLLVTKEIFRSLPFSNRHKKGNEIDKTVFHSRNKPSENASKAELVKNLLRGNIRAANDLLNGTF